MMAHLIFGAFFSVFLAVLPTHIRAQNAPPSSAVLEGTVVNERTRLPIAGATVQAWPLPSRVAPATSRTNSDGSFTLQLDPTKTYVIITRADGYKDLEEKLAFSDQRADSIYGKQIRLEPGNAPKTAMPAVLPTIQFAPRRSELSSTAVTTLRQVAALLEAHPTVRIEAAGHTDTIGDINLNRMLANDRAEAVRTFLGQLGISKNRIDVRSYGGVKPLPGPLSSERRARNKRVELLVLPPSQP
jgi:outer membrane protein OmpA-like peptidoglycan-associated protein